MTSRDRPGKDTQLLTACVDYFTDALADVAAVSIAGNDQHNPGEPIHWARGKSMQQADCLLGHLTKRGTRDTDGHRHSAKVAWRALALLQLEIEEEEGLPPSRGCTPTQMKDSARAMLKDAVSEMLSDAQRQLDRVNTGAPVDFTAIGTGFANDKSPIHFSYPDGIHAPRRERTEPVQLEFDWGSLGDMPGEGGEKDEYSGPSAVNPGARARVMDAPCDCASLHYDPFCSAHGDARVHKLMAQLAAQSHRADDLETHIELHEECLAEALPKDEHGPKSKRRPRRAKKNKKAPRATRVRVGGRGAARRKR